MTLEELLDSPADVLESMSDAQLLEFFKPFFNVTRPELAPKTNRGTRTTEPTVSFAMRQKISQLAELGIDASHLLKKKK